MKQSGNVVRSLGAIVRKAASLCVVWVLAHPAVVHAEERFEVEDDTLSRVDTRSGEILWQVQHASVWASKKREEVARPIRRPVSTSAGWYYAIGPSLLQIDVERGVIQQESSFPGVIVDLEPAKGELDVTVKYRASRTGSDETTVLRYRPGTQAPRETWTLSAWFRSWKDATYLADSIGQRDGDDSDIDHQAAIESLEARRHQEPANAFFDFFIGEAYERLGESKRAQTHYDRAANNDRGSWSNDIQLAMMFDAHADYDRADLVFGRGVEKLDAVHPSLHQSASLATYSVLMGVWQTDAITRAVKAGEYEAVDRMHSRAVRLFPNVEFSWRAWELLASWYSANDRPNLASKWRRRAKDARSSPWFANPESGWHFGLSITFLLAFLAAGWLSAFVIGLRTPPSRRVKGLPLPGKAGAAGLVVALVLPLLALWTLNVTAARIDAFPATPFEVLDLSLGSPNTETWLEGLADSPARAELSEYAANVRRAYHQGEAAPAPLDDGLTLVVDAIKADTRAHGPVWALTKPGPLLRDLGVPDPLPWFIVWAGLVVVSLFAGALFRSLFPRHAERFSWVLPGGATGPATALVAGLAIAASLALLFDLDSLVFKIGGPGFERYFGLDPISDLATPAPIDSHTWAWVSLGAVLLIHGVTVWLDSR